MFLYTLAPIDWSEPVAPSAQPVECLPFAKGYLEGTAGPEGFLVRRVISTDPAAYLSPAYAPGAVYRPGQKSPQNGGM